MDLKLLKFKKVEIFLFQSFFVVRYTIRLDYAIIIQRIGCMISRYNQFNTWLKNKFGERTLKICIDGGFSCPNRDGTKGCGGCIFCGERGSGENTKRIDISTQVKNHLNSYKADRAHKFIAYFQNFSNTYDKVDVLQKRYNSALIDDRIVALGVATRPDCINENVVKLLKEYTKKYYVYVELGLQTSNESVAQKFNRGYSNEEFIKAVNLLNKYNIDIVTHIMVGLPYEEESDINNTVKFINSLNIMGVKIHSTYIIKNTMLESLYKAGKYTPISLDYYVDNVCNIISNLRPDIVVCRITGDAPKDILVEPKWNARKKIVLNSINKNLEQRDICQGDKYIKINN